MAEVLKKFGRYFLLDQIAQGGMAEIYRARLASADGAGRLIVIKRIQAGFGNNTEFLGMFRSEIKVTMGFNHPNIVQLYDYGEEQGQPYIAMELVDGKNLRQFMNRFNEEKKTFPVDMAVYIIEQAASGLHYAHSFRDKISGQPMSIVHRDVSPQNVLISYEGTVKVIDFGIAKAANNSESTRAGVIKGKPSYLSPEQISGDVLDGRSDIFALGIVLWELLVGRKLFAGDNDLAVLKLIESSQTYVKAPSTQNPAVPKDLDYIVLKALAKQRDKRYQTAEELQRALHRFLYSFVPDFNPTDLSYSAKDLFKNEIVDDRKTIQRLNDEVEKLMIASDLVTHHPAHIFDEDTGATPTDRSDHTKHTNTLLDPKPSTVGTGSVPRIPREMIEADFKSGKVEFEDSSAQKSKIRNRPPFDKTATGRASVSRTITRIPAPQPKKSWTSAAYGAVAVLALGFFGPSFGVRIPILSDMLNQVGRGGQHAFTEENPIRNTAAPTVVAGAGRLVLLKLNIMPQGNSTTATINGKPVNMSNPSVSVPVDVPLELVVQNPSFNTVQRQFVVDSIQLGDQKEWTMDVQLDPSNYGFLSLRTTAPADAKIIIDGKEWKKRTPFEKEKLPVGSYTVRLTNDLLEMDRTLTVEIKPGETAQPFDPDREAGREIKLNSRVPAGAN
jgi:serine/threonine protein kinase